MSNVFDNLTKVLSKVGYMGVVMWVWLCVFCGCGYVCSVGVVMCVLWAWLCAFCGRGMF